jgi:hypothetical protein
MSGHWWSGVREPMSEAEQLGDIPLGMGVSFFLFVYSLYVHCTFGRFAAMQCFVNKYWHKGNEMQ